MSEHVKKLFSSNLKVLNIGLETFHYSLKAQDVDVIHVRWQPPPKLEKKLEDALKKIF
jgi:hypothetical protein